MKDTSDEQLFETYRSGDLDAFRLLVERNHDPLIRFLHRLTGDRQIAEDAFQDAFLQVHLSAHAFESGRRFRPWLFTIAANKARDLLRKRGRTATVDLSAPLGGGGGSGEGRPLALIDLMEGDSASPTQRLSDEERDATVQRAIDGMSPTLREVLLLAYFQRLSYAQIAEDLGIPLGTVKSRLHAAVAAFGRRYREQIRAQDAGRNADGGDRVNEGTA